MRTKAEQKQDRNNINDPQNKHRLGTVSKNILLEGLNRFHDTPTSPLVQMWIKTQTQNLNNANDPQKKYRLERSVKIFYWRAKTGFTARQPLTLSSDVYQDT